MALIQPAQLEFVGLGVTRPDYLRMDRCGMLRRVHRAVEPRLRGALWADGLAWGSLLALAGGSIALLAGRGSRLAAAPGGLVLTTPLVAGSIFFLLSLHLGHAVETAVWL